MSANACWETRDIVDEFCGLATQLLHRRMPFPFLLLQLPASSLRRVRLFCCTITPLKTNCIFLFKWVAVLSMSFLKHGPIRRLPLSADFIIPHPPFAHHALVALSSPAPAPSLPFSRLLPALDPSPTLMHTAGYGGFCGSTHRVILGPTLGPAPPTPCCIWHDKPISTLSTGLGLLVESNWQSDFTPADPTQ